MVLEYRETLSEKNHVSGQEMVVIARQMMDGIAYLHEHGLTHGKIHENNIWITPEGSPHIKFGWFGDPVKTDRKLCEVSDVQEAGKLLLNRALSTRCVWEKNDENGQMTNLGKAPIYRPGSVWSDLGEIAIEMVKADRNSTAKSFQGKLGLQCATLSFEEQRALNISFLKQHGGPYRGFLDILTSQTPPTVDAKKATSMVFKMEGYTLPAVEETKGLLQLSLQDLSKVLHEASQPKLWTLGVNLEKLEKRIEDEHLADSSVVRVLIRSASHGKRRRDSPGIYIRVRKITRCTTANSFSQHDESVISAAGLITLGRGDLPSSICVAVIFGEIWCGPQPLS